MKRFAESYVRELDELVRARAGLSTISAQSDVRERLFRRAMERAGASDEAVYLTMLHNDPRAFDELIADLTVPETYFFRDPASYEVLRREVLPALLRGRGASDVLEVWSAGCATGEEAYSLAILLEQESLGVRWNVLGTDVSPRVLARARSGQYGRWSMRALHRELVERYFERTGNDYRVITPIRTKPRFVQHSLVSPSYPAPYSRGAGFDLVLCRNVLIYFDAQSIELVGQRLARSLANGGWLMLGPSDPRLELDAWCDSVLTPCGLLYRRRAADVPSRRARPQRSVPPLRAPSGAPPRVASPPVRPVVPPVPVEPATSLAQLRGLVREHGAAVAEAACRDLLQAQPLDAQLHWVQATLLLDLGRPDEADAALRRALYLDRSLLVAQMLRATLLENRGEHEQAERLYDSLARRTGAQPAEEPVPLGDGMTYGTLAGLAEQRARALQRGLDE